MLLCVQFVLLEFFVFLILVCSAALLHLPQFTAHHCCLAPPTPPPITEEDYPLSLDTFCMHNSTVHKHAWSVIMLSNHVVMIWIAKYVLQKRLEGCQFVAKRQRNLANR